MSNANAITCQIRAIADHVLNADYNGTDLRLIAVEMCDTRAIIEAEILRLDGKAASGKRALRTLLTGRAPEGGAA
jgi:hypothetical protein